MYARDPADLCPFISTCWAFTYAKYAKIYEDNGIHHCKSTGAKNVCRTCHESEVDFSYDLFKE